MIRSGRSRAGQGVCSDLGQDRTSIPSEDGNGRIGRALAEKALAQSLVGCGEKEKLTPPDKWFAKAKKKIESGHYSFVVDPDAEGGG